MLRLWREFLFFRRTLANVHLHTDPVALMKARAEIAHTSGYMAIKAEFIDRLVNEVAINGSGSKVAQGLGVGIGILTRCEVEADHLAKAMAGKDEDE